MYLSSFPRTPCWRECLFSTVYSCLLCCRLIDCMYVGVFWALCSVDLFVYFCANTVLFFFFNFVSAEKAMAPHSSTLAWKIPWTEEPGGLQSMGSLRVKRDWATSLSLFTFHFHALEKEMATHSSVLAWRISGTAEPGGLPSLGSQRVGHDWSDLAAAAASEKFVQVKFFY